MNGESSREEITIPSDLAEAHLIQDRIEAALVANSYTEHDVFAIKLSVEEAFASVIKNDNQMDPDKTIRVAYAVTSDSFDIRIVGEGQR